MALNFTSTDRVNIGSGAIIDNVNTGTFIFLARPTSTADGRLFQKGLFANNNYINVIYGAGSASLRLERHRATTTLIISATLANFSAHATNQWNWYAYVWDTAGANGDQKLYIGNLTAPFAEPSAYASQVVGAGTPGDNSGEDGVIGNNINGAVPFPGRIDRAIKYGAKLTLDQLISIQFGNAIYPNRILDTKIGWNGTGTQPDWSGNGNNGTVTGTTVGDSAPVPFQFPNRQQDAVYLITAGGGPFTQSVSGSSTNSGAIPEVTIFLNSLIGTSSNSSTLQKFIGKIFGGGAANSGAVTPVKISGGGSVFFQNLFGQATNAGILQTVLNPSAGGGIGSYIRGIGYWLRRRMR